MFKHYLPNKNERATVAPKSKFLQLNKGLGNQLKKLLEDIFSSKSLFIAIMEDVEIL